MWTEFTCSGQSSVAGPFETVINGEYSGYNEV